MPIQGLGTAVQGKVANTTASSTNLYDPEGMFITRGAKIGNTIINVTDDSEAQISAIISETTILTSPLSTGRDNTWSDNDLYRIYINDISLSSDLTITFSVGAVFQFSTRIIDARRHARMREYEIQRFGIWANYKNAYSSPIRDKYTGTQPITTEPYVPHDKYEGPEIQYLSDSTPETINMELLYGSTELMKFIYMNPREVTKQTQFGLVTQGQAVLGASLYAPYRRGDLIKIHDKIWIIADIPQFEYFRNREIIGYRLNLELAGGKVQQVKW